jgi:hypothetical protein
VALVTAHEDVVAAAGERGAMWESGPELTRRQQALRAEAAAARELARERAGEVDPESGIWRRCTWAEA